MFNLVQFNQNGHGCLEKLIGTLTCCGCLAVIFAFLMVAGLSLVIGLLQ